MISYLFLACAIICEVIGTLLLPYSKNFTKLTPSLFLVLFYLLAFVFLSFAVREIPLTIVYATWCGLGIFLVSVLNYFLFSQSLSWQGIVGLVLIVVGVTLVNGFKSSPA
ncbi:MAG TPA: QacE family quaternary ammonium compound efflux SMR transporter [Opitutae bacterium]|nr:QacE family quaternary ammonium compound efflux SMR transporter [Opitutae bacterium]